MSFCKVRFGGLHRRQVVKSTGNQPDFHHPLHWQNVHNVGFSFFLALLFLLYLVSLYVSLFSFQVFQELPTGKVTWDLAELFGCLGLTMEGRAHSGIDDCRNIARAAAELVRRGCILDYTPLPIFKGPMPKSRPPPSKPPSGPTSFGLSGTPRASSETHAVGRPETQKPVLGVNGSASVPLVAHPSLSSAGAPSLKTAMPLSGGDAVSCYASLLRGFSRSEGRRARASGRSPLGSEFEGGQCYASATPMVILGKPGTSNSRQNAPSYKQPSETLGDASSQAQLPAGSVGVPSGPPSSLPQSLRNTGMAAAAVALRKVLHSSLLFC